MRDGFLKVAAATPEVRVADCAWNRAQTAELMRQAAEQGVKVVCFPELGLTGYTCADLFLQSTLLRGAERALEELMAETKDLDLLACVGVPVRVRGKLYNCAAVFCRGELLGLVPKTNIPNYTEFYEGRWFTGGAAFGDTDFCIAYAGQEGVEFSTALVFRCASFPALTVGVEICEDVWVADPPSVTLAKGGATVLLNLSCSDEIIGKAQYRRDMLRMHSGRLLAAYVYADSGFGESTTDMIFAGHNLICENGSLLNESDLFTNGITYGDIDVERLVQERRRMNTWQDEPVCDIIDASMDLPEFETTRTAYPYPFVPKDDADLSARCETILKMQATGLATRLKHIGCKTAVIGLSGGLDSTLALLVTANAFDMLGLPRTGIRTVSMPCFGTTARTKSNAQCLAEELKVHFDEIPIAKAVEQHFKDIQHDPEVLDVTYENSQARERTQLLMDIANQHGGIVIGTGDLSELALGWATYNGDHMSMYAVNASIPKTLVRHLVRYEAMHGNDELRRVLLDILDTPVSPELLPPKDGEISQKTEDLVGPYELHDYYLYYMLRFGFTPRKIYAMALRSFAGQYDAETIKKWLKTFYRRFFQQQFKRSCLPDGPKVGSVTLSPRGDFRMPSDACNTVWREEIETL